MLGLLETIRKIHFLLKWVYLLEVSYLTRLTQPTKELFNLVNVGWVAFLKQTPCIYYVGFIRTN
jgi:hypothetical protein